MVFQLHGDDAFVFDDQNFFHLMTLLLRPLNGMNPSFVQLTAYNQTGLS
jgi:hypothetical protein